MTISGDSTGSLVQGQDNLAPEKYDDFAKYLADVVAAYAQEVGRHFQHSSSGQRTCGGLVEQLVPGKRAATLRQARLVRSCPLSAGHLLAAGVKQQPRYPPVTPGRATRQQRWLYMEQRTSTSFQQVNVHGYTHNVQETFATASAYRANVLQSARSLGVHVVMSEWGPLSATTPFYTALILASQIAMDINGAGVEAWNYWQAVEIYNQKNWGLIQADYLTAWNRGKKQWTAALLQDASIFCHAAGQSLSHATILIQCHDLCCLNLLSILSVCTLWLGSCFASKVGYRPVWCKAAYHFDRTC